MLQRIAPSKDGEERRHLDGFLDRLSLSPTLVDKGESPDFFIQLPGTSRSVLVGCEIVRFSAPTEGPTTLGHAHRWLRFSTELNAALEKEAIRVNGTVHLQPSSPAAFDALIRSSDSVIGEIRGLLKRTGATAGQLSAFDRTSEPTLAMEVDHISLSPLRQDGPGLWWCASLQSGELAEPWPSLSQIVQEKNEKARTWNWRNADERWLIVVAEAQTLGDTMILDRIGEAPSPLHGDSFTKVFAWDGFLEQIYRVHPGFELVFDTGPKNF